MAPTAQAQTELTLTAQQCDVVREALTDRLRSLLDALAECQRRGDETGAQLIRENRAAISVVLALMDIA